MPSSSIFLRTFLTSSLRSGSSTNRSISVSPARLMSHPFYSAPREWAVGGRMQLALSEPRKAERLKQRALLAQQLLRHQLANADHLIAVIGVSNEVNVLAERIEHRKVVGRETAEPAGILVVLVQRDFAFEPLLAMREHRAPHMNEVVADDELR